MAGMRNKSVVRGILDYIMRSLALSGAHLCVHNDHYIRAEPHGPGARAPLI